MKYFLLIQCLLFVVLVMLLESNLKHNLILKVLSAVSPKNILDIKSTFYWDYTDDLIFEALFPEAIHVVLLMRTCTL